jgi:mRNA interferase MazF
MANDLSQGSIVLAICPFTDLLSARRRPALVVSATDRPGRDCILAFITSQPTVTDATDLLLDVGAQDFSQTGLRATSVVRCAKLMTLDRTLLTGRLGQLSQGLMAMIDTRLKMALDLR